MYEFHSDFSAKRVQSNDSGNRAGVGGFTTSSSEGREGSGSEVERCSEILT